MLIGIALRLILTLPRFAKRLVVIVLDVLICIVACWASLLLQFGAMASINLMLVKLGGLSVLIAIPIFAKFGLYRSMFRYFGGNSLYSVLKATGFYAIIFCFLIWIGVIDGVPVTIGFIQPMILFFGVAASRLIARHLLDDQIRKILFSPHLPKAAIYGAGSAGRQLASSLSITNDFKAAVYLDDDEKKQGQYLNGIPVFAPSKLSQCIDNYGISHVFLAIPSTSNRRRKQIIQSLSKHRLTVRTLPGIGDLVEGKVAFSDIRELNIDELIDRPPVQPDNAYPVEKLAGKTLMITGAGGSIGSELSRQILSCGIASLILVESSEHALYQIHAELLALRENLPTSNQPVVEPFLCSIQDQNRVNSIIKALKPEVIFHAAAYKHVPIVEQNLSEGIKNNLFGTLVVAQAAIEFGVEQFVLVSTDKAVRPTNTMGATKRLAEMTIQALQDKHQGKTCFSMVRFGNVMGSSGSVVPKFRRQISLGGPITVTDPEVTRFFMTIPEAAQLVIQASSMAKGGEVFVLDMGEPVKIINLAERMITLSGLSVKDENNPNGDIEIKFTGLRPGEKLYEELLLSDNPEPTSHPRVMRANEQFVQWDEFETCLINLQEAVQENNVKVMSSILKQMVSGYQPTVEPVDLIYRRKLKAN